MQVAILSHNARAGDAIGNAIAEKSAYFLDRGAEVRVFIESADRLHPSIKRHTHVVDGNEVRGDAGRYLMSSDLVVVEFGQAYNLLNVLPLIAETKARILFDYHGVTPPSLWSGLNPEALERGQRQRGLAWIADVALVHSQFMRQELKQGTGLPDERIVELGHPIDCRAFRQAESEPDAPARANLDLLRARPSLARRAQMTEPSIEEVRPSLARRAQATGQSLDKAPLQNLRSRLGLTSGQIALFVGRLASNKRPHLLIEAVADLREELPDLHAVFLGDDADIYRVEKHKLQDLAERLDVADRVHFLGHVDDETLRDAYRSADVFVMPSRHEGFCAPVIEAMASGLPVIAARAGALPETVGPAGLTFAPDDVADLGRQLRRVLATPVASPKPARPGRITFVAFRWGSGVIGGAERSLRVMANAFRALGHDVEVFATCTIQESNWKNDLPEGTTIEDGLTVHRFPIDAVDATRHGAAFRRILEENGKVDEECTREYLENSIHSSRLLQSLKARAEEFRAIVAGPYLFGLTRDVARQFPDKTILVPCFHDEALAYLPTWLHDYGSVAGILYHSVEERTFAESTLGLNHPCSFLVGTVLDSMQAGDPLRGAELVGGNVPYVVYCGRYSAQKNLPLLLEYAGRYDSQRPGKIRFVFLGEGDVAIPSAPWAVNLGRADERAKRDILAGAAAVVQLSVHESLSLVALESWAQGRPVIAHARCAPLAGLIQRSGGGFAVDSYDSFATTIDSLLSEPDQARACGERGRAFVQAEYGSLSRFQARLEGTLSIMSMSIRKQMVARGLERAELFDRSRWRQAFERIVETTMHAPKQTPLVQLEIRPRAKEKRVPLGQAHALAPVRLSNRGTSVVLHEGPARHVMLAVVRSLSGQGEIVRTAESPLPGISVPGRSLTGVARVPIPSTAGEFAVEFHIRPAGASLEALTSGSLPATPQTLRLQVGGTFAAAPAEACLGPMLASAESALAEAEAKSELPYDYMDVTEGALARFKKWIKRKVLNNFKIAYVDVLSRRQSAVNRNLVLAVKELAEGVEALDHRQRLGAGDRSPGETADTVAELRRQLADALRRCTLLEERLARIEEQTYAGEEVPS